MLHDLYSSEHPRWSIKTFLCEASFVTDHKEAKHFTHLPSRSLLKLHQFSRCSAHRPSSETLLLHLISDATCVLILSMRVAYDSEHRQNDTLGSLAPGVLLHNLLFSLKVDTHQREADNEQAEKPISLSLILIFYSAQHSSGGVGSFLLPNCPLASY